VIVLVDVDEVESAVLGEWYLVSTGPGVLTPSSSSFPVGFVMATEEEGTIGNAGGTGKELANGVGAADSDSDGE
jgi:hypothetical protein